MKKRIVVIILLTCFMLVGCGIAYANVSKEVGVTSVAMGTIAPETVEAERPPIDTKYELREILKEKKLTRAIQPSQETVKSVTENNIVTEEVEYQESVQDYESQEENLMVEEPEVEIITETAEEPITAEEVTKEEIVEQKAKQETIEEAVIEMVNTEETKNEPSEEVIIPMVQEWSIGIPNGNMKYYTTISSEQLYNSLQSIIDDGNIVKYNNYFAGHNPGAMSHLSDIDIGSTVRVSYGKDEYYDYTIVEHAYASGSNFADVYIGGTTLWDIINSNDFNYIVIQFCIGGQNNFWLGRR